MSRWVLVFMLCSSTAFAGGDWKPSPEHTWWECQKQPASGVSCCSEADGHVLSDADWRMQDTDKGPIYQVRVEGVWYDVPADHVINETRECGAEPTAEKRSMAKVWYSFWRGLSGGIDHVHIYCFMPGTLY